MPAPAPSDAPAPEKAPESTPPPLLALQVPKAPDGFGGKQPVGRLAYQQGGRCGHQRVHRDQIGDEPRPKAHTGISYFSNRR